MESSKILKQRVFTPQTVPWKTRQIPDDWLLLVATLALESDDGTGNRSSGRRGRRTDLANQQVFHIAADITRSHDARGRRMKSPSRPSN
ncbi:MAG: hypothetical protein H6812_01585 [Phycisphaeraceae bacterium]|nr:hypothetical protein [Phycisphaerales bacterium]MCB9841927.1 hypothetical protein [Phycisphaeraceae bacterium]